MKIKLTRTITEEVEVDVEFPFFRRDDNIIYAIYSPTKGVQIIKDTLLNTWQVNTLSDFDVKDKILHDKSNLEFICEEISESEFDTIKKKFLDCL